MQIQVSTRHGQLEGSDQERMREKAGKLVRFFDRLTSIHITADMAHLGSPEVELRATAEGHDDFVSAATATNVIAAFDGAMHKMETQLRKHKEKLTEHRSKSEDPVPESE